MVEGKWGAVVKTLLQISIKDVELRVGIVKARAGIGEYAKVHQRLVQVLGQKDEAHVEDDVFHEEGVVEDQHIDEKQAHVEHRGQQRWLHVGDQGAQSVQVGCDPGAGHAGAGDGDSGRRSQRPQPLRRPGGRRGGSSAIQGAPRGSGAVALGPGRPRKTRLDPRDAPGRITAPGIGMRATGAARPSGPP